MDIETGFIRLIWSRPKNHSKLTINGSRVTLLINWFCTKSKNLKTEVHSGKYKNFLFEFQDYLNV